MRLLFLTLGPIDNPIIQKFLSLNEYYNDYWMDAQWFTGQTHQLYEVLFKNLVCKIQLKKKERKRGGKVKIGRRKIVGWKERLLLLCSYFGNRGSWGSEFCLIDDTIQNSESELEMVCLCHRRHSTRSLLIYLPLHRFLSWHMLTAPRMDLWINTPIPAVYKQILITVVYDWTYFWRLERWQ